MVSGFESFGEYELHERVAVGGMAEVFRATRRGAVGFEQELAIKRILPGLGDDEFTRMFIDEAKIAVRLSHPNVAQVFDLGRVDEQLYIALEYVHGRDMRRVADRLMELNGRAALPPAIAMHVAMRVARALHAAHTTESLGNAMGIIHRDVSPQNVLLSFEGQVKVIDFGLAKAAGRLTQTQAGVVKGKLAYLSCEQARGHEIDHRSDIFSLGTCLFEWLTGQRLFLGKNDLETVMNVQKADVPSIRSLDRSLPMRLDGIVMKALEPDPFMRFATAQEMSEALERLAFEEAMVLTRRTLARFMANVFPEEQAQDEAPPLAAALAAPQVSQAYELDDADLDNAELLNAELLNAELLDAELLDDDLLDDDLLHDADVEPLIDFTDAQPVRVERSPMRELTPVPAQRFVDEVVYATPVATGPAADFRPSGPPADFRPSAMPVDFRPSAFPGGGHAPTPAPIDPPAEWDTALRRVEPDALRETSPEWAGLAAQWEDEPVAAQHSPWEHEPAPAQHSPWEDEPAPAPPGPPWEDEPAGDRRDTMPAPPTGEFDAVEAPAPDAERDPRVPLDLEDAEGPTAQHHVDKDRVTAEFAAPEDEWDEDGATRQVDLGDL